jgi:hypothetical protein
MFERWSPTNRNNVLDSVKQQVLPQRSAFEDAPPLPPKPSFGVSKQIDEIPLISSPGQSNLEREKLTLEGSDTPFPYLRNRNHILVVLMSKKTIFFPRTI